MIATLPAYRIFPLGDSALTIDFGNTLDEFTNRLVVGLFDQLKRDPLPGMIEAVPAYSSISIHYDVPYLFDKKNGRQTIYSWMKDQVERRLKDLEPQPESELRLIRIPVCYSNEFAPDIESLASSKNMSVDEVIDIHTSGTYKVYMLGFLPGFPYMGVVDERIAMPRKPQPQAVQAGSVGIAGRQTGIYPLASPGGWSIIGKTPLKVFDPGREEPTLVRTGDHIQFYSITRDEFESIQGGPA